MSDIHHTAVLLPPAWGHSVCYIHLAVQLLAADPTLVLTIIQHNIMVAMMEKELATTDYDATRLKLVGVGSKDLEFSPLAVEAVFRELLGAWMEFVAGYSHVNGANGVNGAKGTADVVWPKPRTLHMDFTCGGPIIESTKALLGAECKVLMLYTFSGTSLKAHFNEYDFEATCEEIFADETRRNGRTKEEISVAVGTAWNGSDAYTGQIIHNPGVADMYDYERVSHASGPPTVNYPVIGSGQKLAKFADGYILGTTTVLEPVGIPHLREYYKKRGQDVFAVGMQTHERYFAEPGARGKEVVTNERVKAFLDDATAKYGTNSALYISFGSLFFPVTQIPHLEALLDVLLNISPPLPFVFALGGAMAAKALPQSLIDRVNESGKGLICQHWVEQRAILQHGAVGWFLTHGGYNSITEAVVEGMPMIVWPTGAEQPINAAYFSAEPNPIAFELLQTRAGAQIGPSLRHPNVKITGTVEDATKEFAVVLEDARGAKGKRLRENIRALAGKVREARRGEALEEVRRLAML